MIDPIKGHKAASDFKLKRKSWATALRNGVIAASIVASQSMVLPSASASQVSGFQSHQRYISAFQPNDELDIEDSAAVLKYVLAQSDETISVQPTENYSYFKFTHGGLHWQGNMRLETEAGVADKLHFAYFVVPAPWHDEDIGKYKAFSQSDGLTVSRVDDHTYTIRYASLERSIRLSDISKIEIAANKLGPDQNYLGLAQDESGLGFHLLFDTNVDDFSYILDDRKTINDQLIPFYGDDVDQLLVGIRTGFVFIDEPDLQRKRLVGVYSANVSANNYYDGPFDQLPDGYKGKMSVKNAFEEIDSEFAKTIDDFGNFKDREGARVVIAPYIRYSGREDFAELLKCGEYQVTSVDYRACVKTSLER